MNHTDRKPHHLTVQISYEDTDHSGVVYHANYLKLFDLCGWIFKDIAADGSNKSSKQKMVDMDLYI